VLGAREYRPVLANLVGEVVRVADAEAVRIEGFDGFEPAAMRFATPRDWAAIDRTLDRRVADAKAEWNTAAQDRRADRPRAPRTDSRGSLDQA